jgi:hypothetical protein
MAMLMLAGSACMIVRNFYPLRNSAVLPALCYPPVRSNAGRNSEEEKNEKSEVLVRFYPMY